MNKLFKINKKIFFITLIILLLMSVFNFALILSAEGGHISPLVRIISNISSFLFYPLVLILNTYQINGLAELLLVTIITLLLNTFIIQIIINLIKMIFIKKKV